MNVFVDKILKRHVPYVLNCQKQILNKFAAKPISF